MKRFCHDRSPFLAVIVIIAVVVVVVVDDVAVVVVILVVAVVAVIIIVVVVADIIIISKTSFSRFPMLDKKIVRTDFFRKSHPRFFFGPGKLDFQGLCHKYQN